MAKLRNKKKQRYDHKIVCFFNFAGILNDHPRIQITLGSDGESEGMSENSEEKGDYVSPVRMRTRRRLSQVRNL